MPFITSPAIFQIRNAGGIVVSGNARILQFSGEVSVVESSPGVVQIVVGGAGSGGANTVAYFGPDGDLKSNALFAFNESQVSLSFGQNLGGSISGVSSSLTFGLTQTNGTIVGQGTSLCFGVAVNNSEVRAGPNSLVFGRSFNNGIIRGDQGTNNSRACLVFANVDGGRAELTNAESTLMFGNATGSGLIAGSGSIASLIFGIVGPGRLLSNTGQGSLVAGITDGDILNSGSGSIVLGGDLSNSGNRSQVFGIGHVVTTFACLYVGTYSVTTAGNSGGFVSTNLLFVAGNGTSAGSRSNAFELYKDGKIVTTGSQTHRTGLISANTVVTDRTDRSIFVDVTGGAVQVTFPAGTNGLEYFVKHIAGNATVNNITFVGTGGDTVEAPSTIALNNGSRHFVFFNGVWRIMSAYN